MSKHWKEPLDPSRHRDFMTYNDVGGFPRLPPRDPLVQDWSYFVRVDGFTFEFASVAQIRECVAYCQQKTHPTRRHGANIIEHDWQRWFERLPAGLLAGTKRERVVVALERALQEFDSERS